jgi:hypothetical protein
MTAELHAYLVSRGYTVRERQGAYVALLNGEAVSGRCRSRQAAWEAARAHSYNH